MNKLLQQQLLEHFGGAGKVPENFSKLLNVISGSYDHYEKDRKMIERSVELSSKEMIELNTGLKKEKEELKKENRDLKTFFEDINEIVFTIDMVSNRLIQTSAACEKIYGYSPEEFMSDNDLWRKIIHPEDKHIVEQLFQQLRKGKPVINEYRIVHKDESIRWIENKVIPTLGAEGRLVSITGVTSDITGRKQAEDKVIITSNELQRALGDINKIMDASLDVICAVDEEGYFIQVSAACETIWGYKAEELIGKLMIDFVYPEDREKTQKAAMNVIAGNNLINFENRYIRKDGSLVPINWSARWDAKDRIRYGVARDATEKKRSEKALESQRQRYNDLFLQAPSCIGVVRGPNHVYEMANPPYLQLIGKRDIIGKSVREAIPEVVDQGFIELLDRVYKTGKTFSANEMLVKLGNNNANLSDVYLNFICQAYRNNEGNVDGIFFFAIDVTEQVLSRKKIEESELRYRSLVEQATDAICITDASLKFIDINPYALGLFGYTLEEALHLSLPDVLFAEDLAVNPIKLNELKLGKTIRNERRLKRKDGTTVDMAVSTKLIEDGRLIMFGHNISERKESEEALRESEKRLRQIIDLVPHFIFAKDAEGKFILVNEAVATAYGSTVKDLIGKSDADFNSKKEEVEHFMQEDLKIINSGNATYNIEETITDVTGNVRVLSTTKIPYASLGVHTSGVLGVSVDITERKKAEQAIRNSEETTKLIMNSALDAIVGMDNRGYITVWTPQAEKIFGWKEEEVIGKTMAEIIVPHQYRERHQQGFERYLQIGKGVILNKLNELSALNREGKEFPIEINIVPIKQNGTEFFCAFIRDITERKNAEKLLQKSQASLAINNHQLEQKNKELEQFAYVASHDMQEPLRTTSSFVELLQKQYKGKLDEKADKYLTFISQSSDRMKVLIKDLLDYSRIGRKRELAEVDCNIMLNEVLADLGKAISDANAEITADDLPVINGYSTEIKQLFQNLIINAVKFRKQNTKPDINIYAQKKGGYWEFAVKDNGIGIDEQHKERIFIIFQRLHARNEYEGSGIGLAHCKKIVELHGGKIWIDSKPGEGSTFHFTIQQNNN
jgi:PAS domain S-box-containing protein